MSFKTLEYKPKRYLAFVLDEESRAALIAKFPPQHPQLICHHVTIYYDLTEQKLKELQSAFVGEPAVRAIGYTNTPDLDVISVTLDNRLERFRPQGGYYHITHSTEAGVKQVQSNGVLERRGGKPQERSELKLTGKFKLEYRP